MPASRLAILLLCLLTNEEKGSLFRLPSNNNCYNLILLISYNTDFTVATTFSVVNPNFLNRSDAGAEAPNPFIVT